MMFQYQYLRAVVTNDKKGIFMESLLAEILQKIKPQLEREGFHIIGIFGSYARGEETEKSDIDILYRLEPQKFLMLYPGLQSFGRLTEIQKFLESTLHKRVDIADIDGLRATGKKYILKDLCYV